MASVGIKLLAISIAINSREFKHDSLVSREFWFATYDYIVVGAGTAGCVVAARLADDITKTVILLEAGGPQNSTSDIPALRPTLTGTGIDWNYEIVPQKYSHFARKTGQLYFNAGRVFGGTSTLSHLNYYRESPEYFDEWERRYGIKNWSFDEVVPYFLKSENNLDSSLVQTKDGTHRSGGTMPVSSANPDKILRDYFIAADFIGYNETYSDGRQPFGMAVMQRMIGKDGAAQSTATAYFESKMRFNLHSFGNTFVVKIVMDNSNKAIGVRFIKDGNYFTIKARKEVIVCAGVVGSPHLLMLSGIGPKEQLEKLDIPVVSNLRVGHNMRHSVSVDIDYNIKDQTLVEKPLLYTDSEYEYYNDHTGPLAYIASAVHCFYEIRDVLSELSNGCILPHIDFLDTKTDKLVSNLNLRTEWDEYYRPYLGRSIFKLMAVLRRPKSTGSLKLASNNPLVKPLIDPRVFDIQSDVDDLVDVIKQSLTIYHSEIMSGIIEPFEGPVPGCEPCSDEQYCDAYLRCIAHVFTGPLYLVGTCRMGSKADTESVVDDRFRVKGVAGLRVIDTSVLPVPTEQTEAIAIMLGERGAHFIDEDNKISRKLSDFKLNLTENNFWNNLFSDH